MNTNDVGFAFVSFKDNQGGKKRPIFIINVTEEEVFFYSITSQYESKSAHIQKQYYEIAEWKEAGLTKPSWIDIGSLRAVERSILSFDFVGELSTPDIIKLAEFITNYNCSY